MKRAKLDEIQRYLQIEQSTIDVFTRDFAVNPAYALKWGDKVFESAARIDLLRVCRETLVKESKDVDGNVVTMEAKNAYLVQRLFSIGLMTNQPSSTSFCSNLIETQQVAAANWILKNVFRFDGEITPEWA